MSERIYFLESLLLPKDHPAWTVGGSRMSPYNEFQDDYSAPGLVSPERPPYAALVADQEVLGKVALPQVIELPTVSKPTLEATEVPVIEPAA